MICKLISVLILSLFLMAQSKTDDVLEWEETVQLDWSHFQGQPENIGDVVALTASGISFAFSIKEDNQNAISFDTDVKSHFYPKRSWVHKKKASEHILAHEQLHFDITELHVRKFRMQIAQLKISKHIKRDLNRTYQRINKDLAVMQNNYDVETNHSKDTLAQSVWKIKIENALTTNKDYKK